MTTDTDSLKRTRASTDTRKSIAHPCCTVVCPRSAVLVRSHDKASCVFMVYRGAMARPVKAELAGVAGAAAVAVWARKQGPKCPFHSFMFVASTGAAVSGGLYIAYKLWKQRRGSNGRSGVMGLIRRNILELEPYRCARDDYSEGILLDANENSFGSALPADHAKEELERYPDPYQMELKEKIAKLRGVRKEQIFVGVGSDEAIDLLIRVFCHPGQDKILVTPPTYGMYKVCAKSNDVGLVSVPLTPQFEVRVPEIVTAVEAHPSIKLVFLCSPGNPTAKLIPIKDTVAIAEACGDRAMVVVDEAYIDFARDGKGSSCSGVSACQLLDKHANVVVLQTLSKAFGLAGIRCGMAMGNEEVIQVMNNVKAPYNLSKLASNVAQKAFEHLDVLEDNIDKVLKEKKRVEAALKTMPFVKKIHHSDTNFVLFQVPNAYDIYKEMAQGGVVARYRGKDLHCNDCIRLTIGKPHENDTFLERFKKTAEKYLAKYASA